MHPVVGLQPGDGPELHRVGLRDVSAGRAPDRIARGGVRRRAALRFLSLPIRALQPLRAADDVLHAARAAGAAPVPATTARTRDARARSALLAAAQLYCSMYYAVFFTLYARRSSRPPSRSRGRRCAGMLGPAVIAGALALAARAAARAHLQLGASRRPGAGHSRVLQRDRGRLSARAPAQRDVGQSCAARADARARALSGRR